MEINYSMHHFGPQLLLFRNLPEELLQRLRSDSDTLYEDHRENLAGQINDEKAFSEQQRNTYDDMLRPYFNAYMHHLIRNRYAWSESSLQDINNCTQLGITNMWTNRMRAKEYNPTHNHTGHVSFVIYTSVPEEIMQEKQTTTAGAPGAIQFQYMTNTTLDSPPVRSKYKVIEKVAKLLQPEIGVDYRPSTGEMFMFPSYLNHSVLHFNSDVVRESVAGNACFFLTTGYSEAYDRGEIPINDVGLVDKD